MGAVHLRLCRPAPDTPGPVHLALGGGDPCIVHLPPLTGDIELRTLVFAALDADLPPPGMQALAQYDHAVWRGISAMSGGAWQQAARQALASAAVHQDGVRHRHHPTLPWRQAQRISARQIAAHGEMLRHMRPLPAIVWGEGDDLLTHTHAAHQEMHRRPRLLRAAHWQDGDDIYRVAALRWEEMHRRPRPRLVAPWQIARDIIRRWGSGFGPGSRREHVWRIPWGEGADRYGWGGPWWPPDALPPIPPYVGCYPPPRSPDLDILDLLAADRLHLRFWCRRARVIPRRRSYIVIHDIDIYRLHDMHPIPASRVAISIDADAWAWSWSATLLGRSALDAVMPDSSGTPVVLAAEIDGHVWHLLVESWREDRSFGRRSVDVSGRGLTAWLDAPYALPGAGASAADLTLQQLIAAHLPSGWALDWQAPNWLVPAGAWTWQGLTPAQAAHAAAQGVGLVLVPARAAHSIRVQPRYPVWPWDYATASPDIIIPDDAILGLERQAIPPTQANAVYVHGGETGGILARVRRTGTAGDRLADTATHPLITHADAARALGGRILADQHRQPAARSVVMPLGGAFPLAQIGQLARIEDGPDVHLGTICAVAIDAGMAESVRVRQTITLGSQTPNRWSALRALLPDSPLLAGQVTADYTDGTALVQLIGGGSIRVRGEGAIGQRVYIRDHAIIGPAPTLPMHEIEL